MCVCVRFLLSISISSFFSLSPDNMLRFCRKIEKSNIWLTLRNTTGENIVFLLLIFRKNWLRRKTGKETRWEKGGGTPTLKTHRPYTIDRGILQTRTAQAVRIFVQHKTDFSWPSMKQEVRTSSAEKLKLSCVLVPTDLHSSWYVRYDSIPFMRHLYHMSNSGWGTTTTAFLVSRRSMYNAISFLPVS